MNIFVTKLSFNTQSEDLREAFEAYGAVSSAKVIEDRETGRSRGFGFVEMDNDDEAMEAIRNLNESELDGRTIIVKKAEPRNDRGGNDRGGSDRGGSRGGYSNRGGGGGNDRGGYSRRNNNW